MAVAAGATGTSGITSGGGDRSNIVEIEELEIGRVAVADCIALKSLPSPRRPSRTSRSIAGTTTGADAIGRGGAVVALPTTKGATMSGLDTVLPRKSLVVVSDGIGVCANSANRWYRLFKCVVQRLGIIFSLPNENLLKFRVFVRIEIPIHSGERNSMRIKI